MDAKELPLAVGELLRINDHEVEYDVEINGAQIDLTAKSISNPFMPTMYIEVTVEHVDNNKYAKDLTKFAMLRQDNPQCICISISTKGFTAPVRERAAKTGIQTLTYDELFRKFEKFASHIDFVNNDSLLAQFVEDYEEPFLSDIHGENLATSWLEDWLVKSDGHREWLIVLGEYGTGKTSLTKVLQYRWMNRYKTDPTRPFPVRIELRQFARQLDARSLLHHFLDSSGLSHIPIEFLILLMRKSKIVLLLDGYDEMAQFLNFRERRACLAALAELSGYGAKGILTSRPNYFTEGEELKVFEALYDNISRSKIYVGKSDQAYIDKEKETDNLIARLVLERYERSLRDLTPDQTNALVRRQLQSDPIGRDIVLGLLNSVFREDTGGKKSALSGKPVIISYLLELIEEIKKNPKPTEGIQSEWTIYNIIVDRLMLRDQHRATIPFDSRRLALQSLAVALSQRSTGIATDDDFYNLVDQQFKHELRTLLPEERQLRRLQLVEDMRSSSTLTRAKLPKETGSMFSHNSLREFLAVEYFVADLFRTPHGITIPITSAMRSFASAMPSQLFERALTALQAVWPSRHAHPNLGGYVSLFWNDEGTEPRSQRIIDSISSSSIISFDGVNVSDIALGESGSRRISGRSAGFTNVDFIAREFDGDDYKGATFDSCLFASCNFSGGDFSSAFFYNCVMVACDFEGGNFTELEKDTEIAVRRGGETLIVSGEAAKGYLSLCGGKTDQVSNFNKYQFHESFPIILKVADKLTSQAAVQYLGLTQKGEARSNPRTARRFVDHCISAGIAEQNKNKTISLTSKGRTAMSNLLINSEMSDEIAAFLAIP